VFKQLLGVRHFADKIRAGAKLTARPTQTIADFLIAKRLTRFLPDGLAVAKLAKAKTGRPAKKSAIVCVCLAVKKNEVGVSPCGACRGELSTVAISEGGSSTERSRACPAKLERSRICG